MPVYDFVCSKCEDHVEEVFSIADRDATWEHEGCGGKYGRQILKAPGMRDKTQGKPMGAIIVDRNERKVGTVAGHFGKEAKRIRKQ